MNKPTNTEELCIKYYNEFLMISRHNLPEDEEEVAFSDYMKSSKDLMAEIKKPSDLGVIMRTVINCYRDDQNFKAAIEKVLKLRGLI